MRIDKKKFYEGTCKRCKRLKECQGSQMHTCARMRTFNYPEFENYTGIRR